MTTKQLILDYKRTQDAIILGIAQIAKKELPPDALSRSVSFFVKGKLEEINKKSKRWARDEVAAAYNKGVEDTNRSIEKQYEDAKEDPPPRLQVDAEETEAMEREASERFIELSLFAAAVINQMLITSSFMSPEDAGGYVLNIMAKRGVPAYEYPSAGTTVSAQLDSHAALTASTILVSTYNQAVADSVAFIGGDLVLMSQHSPTCPICFPLQGRVYSLSGSNPDYPFLGTAFSSGHANIHPNCKHFLTPYFPLFKTPRQIERDKARSNAPFELSGMSQRKQDLFNRQLRAYTNAQKANARILSTRRQWQRYRSRLGRTAPGFRKFSRLKRSAGETWLELQADYREAGRLL